MTRATRLTPGGGSRRASTRSRYPPTHHTEGDPGEVGDGIQRVAGAVREEHRLDDLAEHGVHREDGRDHPAAEAGDHGEGDRHEEDGEVRELVGLRERRRSHALRCVEHDELDGHGQGQRDEQAGRAGPAGATAGHGRRDRRDLARRDRAHACPRAATAARTASATTLLTSGWKTLGMM